MRRAQATIGRLVQSSRLSRSAQRLDPVHDLALNYVAGEDVADAVEVAADLSRKGLSLCFTRLGVDCDATAATASLLELLDALPDARGVDLSVRPSVFGSAPESREAHGPLVDLCAAAARRGATVTLEMQGHAHYLDTIRLARRVLAEVPDLGVTLPVDIRRAERDAREFAERGARVRACIGAYPAPTPVAYRSEHEKSLAFVRVLRVLFASNARPMVASHDPRIVEIAQELARRNGRAPDSYEFQMMLGVRPLEQRRLVDIGLVCRTYVPYGPGWYEHLSNRIAARPRVLWSYARAILDKR